MSTTLRNLQLIDFCTPSIAYDRQVQAGCKAFDNQMHEIIDDTPVIIFISQILQLADSNLIDILAWQFHVDFYDQTRPLEFRRQLVFNSIQWHMRKGTVQLVQDVLDMFWPGGATITEWFEYMSPLPPNYPVDNVDTMIYTFTPSQVSVTGNTFTINGHTLVNNDQIRFELGAPNNTLPQPMLAGLWYRVVNKTTNTFKIAPSLNGSPIDFITAGTGTNQIWRHGAGTWHDRYRFRILIDEQIIRPEDQAQVVALINAYKPVSRWLEGFFRMTASECHIGWAGMTLQFIIKESEAPNYP